jgi:hypothetical protein
MSDFQEKQETIRRSTAYPERMGQREAKLLRLSQAYSPSNPGAWVTPPETLEDALDQLAGAGVDGGGHHSGWYRIQENQTVTILENRQSIIHGLFYQDGVLLVEGILILEP